MENYLFLLGGLFLHFAASSTHGACPCAKESLCEPVESSHNRPQVLGWNVNPKVWQYYDWDKITTVGVFRTWDSDADEMLCHAHANNVRVVLPGNFPVANLTSTADRKKWVDDITARTLTQHTDGVNFDVESPIAADSPERHALILLINETRNSLLRHNAHVQITADVAWSPDCIDGRCYDVKGMAEVTDFLAIMSYDERSQIFPPLQCIAMSNSPVAQTFDGVQKYIAAGITPEKLLLGQPWYGYNYPCETYDNKTNVCAIAKVPFRGANCSDAAGREYPFSWIMSNMKASGAKRQWNTEQEAPFYTFMAADGKHHQVSTHSRVQAR